MTSGSSPKANRDLFALADYVPLNITTNTLERSAAEEVLPEVQLRDGKRVKSNRFFTDLQRHAFRIRSAHALQEDFAKELRGYASRIVELDERSESVVRRVTDYAWRSFDPAKTGQRPLPGQGALRDECRGKPLGETQALGGRYVAEMRHGSTFDKLLQASKRLIDRGACCEGEVPSARLLAAESGTSERQCRRYHEELRAALMASPESPISNT